MFKMNDCRLGSRFKQSEFRRDKLSVRKRTERCLFAATHASVTKDMLNMFRSQKIHSTHVRVCVCVCVWEREFECVCNVCVWVCVWEIVYYMCESLKKMCMCVWLCDCIYVSVCVCVCVCVWCVFLLVCVCDWEWEKVKNTTY